jgi:hypothetical protein
MKLNLGRRAVVAFIVLPVVWFYKAHSMVNNRYAPYAEHLGLKTELISYWFIKNGVHIMNTCSLYGMTCSAYGMKRSACFKEVSG